MLAGKFIFMNTTNNHHVNCNANHNLQSIFQLSKAAINQSTNQPISCFLSHLAPVVQKVDNAIDRINHYPLDIAIGFAITYTVDNNLSGG